MLKTQIFALMFVFMFLPGMNLPTGPSIPAAKAPVAKKAVKPSSFRGFSGAELARLKAADAAVSRKVMTRKAAVKKAESTFTWEYFLIFAVIALGAFLTLMIA